MTSQTSSTTKRTYTIKRLCCRSGLCIDCHKRGNHGDTSKRVMVVQADGLSKKMAEKYLAGWRDYGAVMECDQQSRA